MTPSDDAPIDGVSEAARQLVKHSEHIAMMLGPDAKTVISFPDPDEGINGEYRVMRSHDGVYSIVHLEDGLYTSQFFIGRDALFQMVDRLSGYFTNRA